MKVKKYYITGIFFIALFAIFFVFRFYFQASGNDKPQVRFALTQNNIRWQNEKSKIKENADNSKRGILIRSEENHPGNILVKFNFPAEMYKYNGENKAIVPVSEQEWLAGKNEISCSEREYKKSEFIEVDEFSKTLLFQNAGQINTFGQYALEVLESPNSNSAIILSADGPKTKGSPGFIFGGQSGEILGQRYVQILNRQTKTYKTEPLGLISTNKSPNYGFCWSDNEKFVIAYEVEYIGANRFEINFHVIETNQ